HWIALGTLAGSSPVWVWNLLNDFISVRFQVQHGLGRPTWKPSWTYTYVLLQIGLVFPVILVWALRSTRIYLRAAPWLWMLAWGPLVFFFCTSFRGYAEANWPIIAYAEVFALGVLAIDRPTVLYRAVVVLWSVASVVILTLILTRWSPTGHPIKTKEFF